MRSWIFHGNALYEAPISSRFPSSNVSCNFSRVSDLCFGLALSPGGLMLAVVRSLDANLLNQMYEKRSQRAVVEFFWTGGQSLKVPSIKNLDNCRFVSFHSSCAPELVSWEANIFQSLLCFEDVNKPVVMWDLVTLLSNLMKEYPDLVENILNKWVSSWFSESSFGSCEEINLLFHDCDNLLTVSSRKLQLLNIICRRVLVTEMKSDLCEDYQPKSGKITSKERKPDLWKELLMKSERELLERLVAFSFQAVLNRAANLQSEHENHSNWSPVGVAQMERWTSVNLQTIHSQLKALGSDVATFRRRKNNRIPEFLEEESCSFCSAPVPFESTEVAWCQGAVNPRGSIERHKLTRCMASMRLCSAIEPVWFCICCRRQAANLLPRSFFAMPKSPLDLTAESASAAVRERPKPLCPYCGILLQRSMPDFLLSSSPV